MVLTKNKMKRKRKNCTSPLLDDSPKRTKVHAQRKFAQGSNVNSPVITPVKEIEKQEQEILPEPVELLPIKRPNTEDFLTFLCFRGTPILPPSLNFFNTASIVDTNGQVHEIKSESPKNGPIDTGAISKASGTSDRPFIAFGVRKRADPIVISKQMDRKRRHALALQALRRKYQEQRMAKIRAVTISKLSETKTNKTMVRSNSISKTETVLKKSSTIQKTNNNKVSVVATKQVKVTTTQTVKTTIRPKIKPKMCLRSFRGRFIQRELQFRNNVKKKPITPMKNVQKKANESKAANKEKEVSSDYSSDDHEPLSRSTRETRLNPKVVLPKVKVAKKSASGPKKPSEMNFRVTRSNKFMNNKITSRRQQIKQLILTTPTTLVKPRMLRSHNTPKGEQPTKPKYISPAKQKIIQLRKQKEIEKTTKESTTKETAINQKKIIRGENTKREFRKDVKEDTKKETTRTETSKRSITRVTDTKKSPSSPPKTKPVSRNDSKIIENLKRREQERIKLDVKKVSHVTAESELENNEKESTKKNPKSPPPVKKPVDTKKTESPATKKVESTAAKKPEITKKPETTTTKKPEPSKKVEAITKKSSEPATKKTEITPAKKPDITPAKKSDINLSKKPEITPTKKTEIAPVKKSETTTKKPETITKKEVVKKDIKTNETKPDEGVKTRLQSPEHPDNAEIKISQRPSRKTKEAAAIYMEILSHKLVNDSKIDDDSVSIDSFPELPNVKKTEQRENELKAKAKSTKGDKRESSPIEKEVETKSLRSQDKKKIVKKSVPEEKNTAKKDNPSDSVEQNIDDNQQTKKAEKTKKNEDNPSNKPTKDTKDDLQVSDRKTRSSAAHDKLSEKIVEKIEPKPSSTTEVENEMKEQPLKKKDIKENPIKRKIEQSKGAKDSDTEASSSKIRRSEEKEKVEETVKIVEEKQEIDKKAKPKEVIAEKKSKNDNTSDKKQQKEEITPVEPKTKPKETKVDIAPTEESKPKSEENVKRKTRNASQVNKESSSDDDSDESFRADVKIPRKRLITRNKSVKSYKSENEDDNKKVLRNKTATYKEMSSSESDHSTTSDVKVKQVKPVAKKRYTKTRSQQKSDQSFSDSDEEPLSKLTQSKNNDAVEKKETEDSKVDTPKELKPKRECAKRPQNYLPMFSSSDEEESFFIQKSKPEKVKTSKVQVACSHAPTASDIGRRFGKGKVNMSNEQIEQWLKDSAMAGSIKSENEEMMKFCEKIPTETSFSVANLIDTKRLKASLLLAVDEKSEELEYKKKDELREDEKSIVKANLKASLITDRKLIFRKDKHCIAPNVNAFSVSNESSVYAFEETEDIMKAPFRRPSRRPSSTATSKSEDEFSKLEEATKLGQFRKPTTISDSGNVESSTHTENEDSDHLFYTPTNLSRPNTSNVTKTKSNKQVITGTKPETATSTSMVPPSTSKLQKHKIETSKKPIPKSVAETVDDFKYKVPSSPSASSSSSANLCKKQTIKPKLRTNTTDITPITVSEFPTTENHGQLVEAPTFHPTDKEFQDPIEFIEKIRSKAEQFGICRIVPPSTFKPECKVTDDMRFTAYNQYVHKMLHRWGPNFKELMAIKKYLSTQNINLTQSPWIGGMEIDLPRLYQTVQTLGGLKEVIEKKKWPKVSDLMKIPKSAQDRVTKLDDIYCKYLLPYDTLSPAEREKLFDEVETDWAKRESRTLQKTQQNEIESENESEMESDDEAEECIVKGRGMALNAFYRIARNTMSMWFKTTEPTAEEVEQEFWKNVTLKQNHICVHSGSIDSGNYGYGFAVSKNSPFARHAWNLKVLTNNSGSVLRSMGPVMGVTVPTLHVGMVFSSGCWYRDPHSLPWIEYLHTGGNKIWYGIPDSISNSFKTVMKKLVPNYCRNKTLWLPSDTVMVPPNLLVENGVSLSRIVQKPGEFVIVFPKAFTSSLSTGYVVSESVYFAPPYWLNNAQKVFDELRNNCEPSMFSFERLLLSIVNDSRSNVEVLKQITPIIIDLCNNEKKKREKIRNCGVTTVEKLPLPEAPNARKRRKLHEEDREYECDICRMNLFVSMVTETQDDGVYCLDHAVEQLEKKKIISKNCKLMYAYDDEELESFPNKIAVAIEGKLQKRVPNKYSGMPTLLTK